MIYIVGDSTVAKFEETYFYHRAGWGTEIETYFTNKPVLNLALSGRSSKSFTKEKNYEEFLNIKSGDFVFIGFGHNDEKFDDPNRFTDATKELNDPTSFKYSLYNNYIKVAKNVGATAILVTPIVRLAEDNNYINEKVHITKYGDYRKAIVELASEVGVDYVDLTTFSRELAIKQGYEEACLTHAITKGKYVNECLEPDILSVDATHINQYGAKLFAHFIAKTLLEKNNPIKEYIVSPLCEPTKADLVMDKGYVYIPYVVPDFSKYEPKGWFDTKSQEYIGTCFGDTGRQTHENSNGFRAIASKNGFTVGSMLKNGNEVVPLGKIALNSEGVAMVAKKISVDTNFIFSCTASVLEFEPISLTGFGISLRDDLYINQTISDKTITSNYVACGFVTSEIGMNINFSRENHVLKKSEHFLSEYYKQKDVVKLLIKRVGQVVEVKTIYNNITYDTTYTDFDFTQIDKDNFYITMFSSRNTVVEFSDIEYKELGKSLGA